MTEKNIILNNQGNSVYAQTSREFITSPVKSRMIKVLLDTADQLDNIIKIRNSSSFGGSSNRDISLRNFISATDKTDLIVDINLNDPIILNGQTYIITDIEPSSQIDIIFYIEQFEISSLLKNS